MSEQRDRRDMRETGGADGNHERSSGSQARSAAEWTTLGISLVILLGMASLVTYLYRVEGTRPPVIEAQPLRFEGRQEGSLYYLPIEIRNTGDQTVADVVVETELVTPDGASETAEIEVTFLAGGAMTEGVVVFSSDPRSGELTVRALSFDLP